MLGRVGKTFLRISSVRGVPPLPPVYGLFLVRKKIMDKGVTTPLPPVYGHGSKKFPPKSPFFT